MANGDVPNGPEPRTPNPEPRNRNWIWFFVSLVLLGAAAVSINWAYNRRQQLTMAELQRNEDLWEKKGPADYDLTIEKTIQSAAEDAPQQHRIDVQVRHGKVVTAKDEQGVLARRLWDEYDMSGWFGFIERFLQIDSAAGAPRTFCSAEFDPATGQLRHYIRSISTTRERQELTLRLTPAEK
jgi:hypothetical protein